MKNSNLEKDDPKNNHPKKDYIETEFLAGIESILAARLSVAAWFIPLAFMVLVIVLIVWAWVAEVDVSSPATGEMVPSHEVQLVQPKEVGVVAEIYVKNGDKVSKGQLLVQLEYTDINGQLAETTQQIHRLAIEVVVLQQQKHCFANPHDCTKDTSFVPQFVDDDNHADTPMPLSAQSQSLAKQVFVQRWQNFLSQQELRQNQIAVLMSELAQKEQQITYSQQILPMYQKRLQRMQTMQKEQLAAGSKVEESAELVMEQQQVLNNAKSEKQNLLSKISVSKSELQSFIHESSATVQNEWFSKLSDYRAQRTSLQRLQGLLEEKRIVSPVNGTIYDRAIATEGGVVQSAEVLMKVLPEEAFLQAKINILNKDRGFIQEGDGVVVKVDAYPFTKHGSITGVIQNISSAAIVDEQLGPVYPATVSLNEFNVTVAGAPAKIMPGMTLTADIHQGKRRLAEYILTPLLRYKDEALRER